jgi:hypothetical protein
VLKTKRYKKGQKGHFFPFLKVFNVVVRKGNKKIKKAMMKRIPQKSNYNLLMDTPYQRNTKGIHSVLGVYANIKQKMSIYFRQPNSFNNQISEGNQRYRLLKKP